METSSSLRQASSSWAKVLGGGRGGMAGSWTKGWAGWWLRRCPQFPPPPHVCVCVEEAPKDFLVLWLLKGRKICKITFIMFRQCWQIIRDILDQPKLFLLTCDTWACLAVYFPESTATHSGWGLLCCWVAVRTHSPPDTSLLRHPQLLSDKPVLTESWNAWKVEIMRISKFLNKNPKTWNKMKIQRKLELTPYCY